MAVTVGKKPQNCSVRVPPSTTPSFSMLRSYVVIVVVVVVVVVFVVVVIGVVVVVVVVVVAVAVAEKN